MEVHREHLLAKGWSEEEIKHARKILAKAKRTPHPHQHMHAEVTFWALLLLAAFTATAIAYWLIPIITILPDVAVYPLLLIISVPFGLHFTIVLHDLEHLTTRHHILMHVCIPLAAIISFLAVVSRTNSFGKELHSGLLTGAVYALGFLAPYTYHYLRNKK